VRSLSREGGGRKRRKSSAGGKNVDSVVLWRGRKGEIEMRVYKGGKQSGGRVKKYEHRGQRGRQKRKAGGGEKRGLEGRRMENCIIWGNTTKNERNKRPHLDKG